MSGQLGGPGRAARGCPRPRGAGGAAGRRALRDEARNRCAGAPRPAGLTAARPQVRAGCRRKMLQAAIAAVTDTHPHICIYIAAGRLAGLSSGANGSSGWGEVGPVRPWEAAGQAVHERFRRGRRAPSQHRPRLRPRSCPGDPGGPDPAAHGRSRRLSRLRGQRGQAAASVAGSGSRSVGKLPDVRANSLIQHFLSILFFFNLDLLHSTHRGGGVVLFLPQCTGG